MNRSVKLLLILIIIILATINFKTAQDTIIKDNNPATEKKEKPKEISDEEKFGKNLVTDFKYQLIVDTNGDASFDEVYGDELIKKKDVKKETGININFQIFDSNDNGTVDIGETTHAKFTINNASDKSYTIQDIKIVGQGSTFSDGDITSLTTTNAGNIAYKIDGVNLSYPKGQAYILPPDYETAFEFDLTWSNADRVRTIAESEFNEAPYVGISFIASSESDNPYYIEINNETINFSTEEVN